MSSVHGTAVERFAAVVSHLGMAGDHKALARRLKITREAIGLIPAELCRRIEVKPNRWSQYESGERPITLDVANRLCDEFGLSLDWIYRNNPALLAHDLRLKIQQLQRKAA